MGLCPAAEQRLITVNFTKGGCHPRLVILHIMAGTMAGTDSWFRNPAAQVSAHFGVPKTGRSRQWVNTSDTAWHAANANPYAIGIENEGKPGDAPTRSQITEIAKILAWAHTTHGIPLQVCNDPAGKGLAWHGLGGVPWGNHPNCPGTPFVRARQAMVDAALALTGPVEEEDDMLVLDLPVGERVALPVPAGKHTLVLHADTGVTVGVGWHPAWAGRKAVPVSWPDGARVTLPAGAEVVSLDRQGGTAPVTVTWA